MLLSILDFPFSFYVLFLWLYGTKKSPPWTSGGAILSGDRSIPNRIGEAPADQLSL